LDFLKTKNIKATFFVIGSRVFDNPDILKRAFAEGHQIGVHTWSHPTLTSQTNDQVIAELWWTATIINQTIGVWPRYMRPPTGDIDDRVRTIVRALNMVPVMWIDDSNDWQIGSNPNITTETVIADVKTWVANKTNMAVGPVTLEHDLKQVTRDLAINNIIPMMTSVYTAKRVDECAGPSSPEPYVGVPKSTASTASNTTSSTNPQTSSRAAVSSGAYVRPYSLASVAILVVMATVFF